MPQNLGHFNFIKNQLVKFLIQYETYRNSYYFYNSKN